MVEESITLKDKFGSKYMNHKITIELDALSINEGFARIAVAAFVTPLDPTLEELADVKTAVSEAVTNAIIHGYNHISEEKVLSDEITEKIILRCALEHRVLHIEVEDFGHGIENIEQAMEPLFTTKKEEERSGMGFSFMEAFMDDLEVISEVGVGTKICMTKKFGSGPWIQRLGE